MVKLNVSKQQYTNSIKIPSSEPTPPKPVDNSKLVETKPTETYSTQTTEKETSVGSNKTSQSKNETENALKKQAGDKSASVNNSSTDFPSVSLDFSNVVPEVSTFDNNPPSQGVAIPSSIPREDTGNHEYNSITGLRRNFQDGGKPESRSIQIDTNSSENQTYVNGTAVPNNGIHITIKGDNNTININSHESAENKVDLPSEKEILGVSTLEELNLLTDRLSNLNRLVDSKRIILEAERKYL